MGLRSYAVCFASLFAGVVYFSSIRWPSIEDLPNIIVNPIWWADFISGHRLYTPFELSEFDGVKKEQMYIAILGKVYDVSSAPKYYGPGQSYYGFVGRDASRAFLSGDFSPSGLTDDLTNLPPVELRGLFHWVELYERSYQYKGKLIGRFYDKYGNPTSILKDALKKIEEAEEVEDALKELDRLFPPCNLEMSLGNGRVAWCSKKSGGIQRDWIGYPRKFYPKDKQSYRCACVQFPTKLDSKHGKFESYQGCAFDSTRCKIIDDDDDD